MTGDGEGGVSLGQLASLSCKAAYASWSWRGNELRTVLPSITGSRTASSWWHSDITQDWVEFTMGGGANHEQQSYSLNSSQPEWSYNHWEPNDKGGDDFQLESALNRINLETDCSGIEYMALPGRREATDFGYHMESMVSARLANRCGWHKRLTTVTDNEMRKKWGWGMNVIIRDWDRYTLKKVVLSTEKASILEASYFVHGSMLFRGRAFPPPGGTSRDYLLRPSVTSWEKIQGNLARVVSYAARNDPEGPGSLKATGTEERGSGVLRGSGSGSGTTSADTSKSGAAAVARGLVGPALQGETIGGRRTDTTPQPSAKLAGATQERVVTMVSADVPPKPGTTAEMAEMNLDHRERSDIT